MFQITKKIKNLFLHGYSRQKGINQDLMVNAFNDKIKKGDFGEDLVAQWLIKEGFVIKEKKYRKRFGEIDIIAQQGDLLVFVEVKLRKHNYFDLTEVIVPSKQRKVILAAKEYLVSHNIEDKICRFDVALVERKDNNFEIRYIPNAFTESF